MKELRTQVAIVGAGPAGLLLGQLLDARRHRQHRHRTAQSRLRREAGARGRHRARYRQAAGRRRAPARACCAKVSSTTEWRLRIRRRVASDRPERVGRRPLHHGLRSAGGRQGPDRPASGRRAPRCTSTPRSPSIDGLTSDAPVVEFAGAQRPRACHVRRTWRGATAPLASRIVRSPTASCGATSERIPFSWLGILARGPARDRGTDLLSPRERLRALLAAFADASVVSTWGCDPTRSSTTGPTSGSGTNSLSASRPRRARASTRARSSNAASPPCAASSSSPCATADSSSPATPPTSCRRRGPRG